MLAFHPTRALALAIAFAACGCGDSTGTSSTLPDAGTDASSSGGATTGGTSSGTGGASAAGAAGASTGGASAAGAAGASTGGASTAGAGGANGGTTSGGAAGAGGSASECAAAVDCLALFGLSPCGTWACVNGACEASSAGCTDADQDGYGTGTSCSCAGIDCDDTDDTIQDTASKRCYSGPAGTAGVGTCVAGVQNCTAGSWTPCTGEVTPSGEACNNQDDDCDGTPDDGLGSFSCGIGACATTAPACTNGVVRSCVPGTAAALDGPQCDGIDSDCDGAIDEDCKTCVPVSLTGNDATADGTFVSPFLTIQAAIDWAAAHAGPKTVCVAAAATCGSGSVPVTGTYTNAAGTTVTMADGISVLGNYESTNWNRCPTGTTTVIQPRTAEGVTFPSTVTKITVLDGFRIDRYLSTTAAAVTVDGATNVILSGLTINNTFTYPMANSYGINVINGGGATITRGRIDGGQGSSESIGVRSVGSRVTIQDNCLSLNASGRCDDGCSANYPSIRGRTTPGTGVSYGVLLQDSPGSVVETSSICAQQTADQTAAIRIEGDGAGILVRASNITAFSGVQDSHGVWMEDCAGAAPWIVDNNRIQANGSAGQSRADGVRAIGDCHPVIDSNVQIVGGGEGTASSPNGVHCGENASAIPSRCVVLGNALIQGSNVGFPPSATGVRCDGGSCMRIAGNTISGRGGVQSYGVYLDRAGTFVDDNTISGGCSNRAWGMYASDSWARVQNNRIFGFSAQDCPTGATVQLIESHGITVVAAAGGNEMDVHSNDIDGTGRDVNCASSAIDLDASVSQPPSGALGIFRNNILRAGTCLSSKVGLSELVAGADPRLFENNDLDPFATPSALYLDEGITALNSATQVDALTDTSASGNISADPVYVNYPTDLHIQTGSACIGAGTPAGAPLMDMDGQPRDPLIPDIGADEN